MIFDTDIFIWMQKGNEKAARLFEQSVERYLSIQSYMELFQGARSKSQHKIVKDFLLDFEVRVLPLTENIGHRASIYVEDYSLSHGVRAGDAIIAATAMENNRMLVTSNGKHFKCIPNLALKIFKPH